VSMIEKVAASIAAALWERGIALNGVEGVARAAIEAMREPSEGMVAAAADAYVEAKASGDEQWFRTVLRAALSAALKGDE
jgi:urease gamma subunit